MSFDAPAQKAWKHRATFQNSDTSSQMLNELLMQVLYGTHARNLVSVKHTAHHVEQVAERLVYKDSNQVFENQMQGATRIGSSIAFSNICD